MAQSRFVILATSCALVALPNLVNARDVRPPHAPPPSADAIDYPLTPAPGTPPRDPKEMRTRDIKNELRQSKGPQRPDGYWDARREALKRELKKRSVRAERRANSGGEDDGGPGFGMGLLAGAGAATAIAGGYYLLTRDRTGRSGCEGRRFGSRIPLPNPDLFEHARPECPLCIAAPCPCYPSQ